VRVLADGQTHRQTDRQTDRQTQTDFIICPMLYAIAMGQIIRYKASNLCQTELASGMCDESLSVGLCVHEHDNIHVLYILWSIHIHIDSYTNSSPMQLSYNNHRLSL